MIYDPGQLSILVSGDFNEIVDNSNEKRMKEYFHKELQQWLTFRVPLLYKRILILSFTSNLSPTQVELWKEKEQKKKK